MDSITTGSFGRSRASFGTREISSTTSIPSVTRPKTVCLPSSHGHASAVTMKNWLPFVFGPAFAIASAPRSTLCWLNSSRSEEHTSELQSHVNLVCRLLLEKKKEQRRYCHLRTPH